MKGMQHSHNETITSWELFGELYFVEELLDSYLMERFFESYLLDRVICWRVIWKVVCVWCFFWELFVGQSYLLKSYLESCLCLVSFLSYLLDRVICWRVIWKVVCVWCEFFGELFVGQSYLLKSYLESCLCLVSFSEVFYVCALVSLPLFLSLSFFLCVCVWWMILEIICVLLVLMNVLCLGAALCGFKGNDFAQGFETIFWLIFWDHVRQDQVWDYLEKTIACSSG